MCKETLLLAHMHHQQQRPALLFLLEEWAFLFLFENWVRINKDTLLENNTQ